MTLADETQLGPYEILSPIGAGELESPAHLPGDWRRDGKELYYLALDGKLMAVDIRVDPRIESGAPRRLFDTKLRVDPIRDQFAVTPDGERFLIEAPVSEGSPTPRT